MLYRDPAREVWQVEGERAIDALNGLFTNDLSGPEPGVVIPCLALTPRGRPLADLRVWKRSPESGPMMLDLSAAGSEPLREHLGRYLPPRFARIVPLEDASLISVWGPRASSVLTEVLGGDFEPAPAAGFSEVECDAGRVLVAGHPDEEGGGWEILVPHGGDRLESALAAAVMAAGGESVSDETWERLRIERGIPRYGVDYGLENLPQETGLVERTVSFEKGCYTGQEVVARIHYRGHVNQRLTGLSRDEGGPIPVGAELFDGDRRVGEVSSATHSREFGAIALGMVRREVATGSKLSTSPGGQRTIEVRSLPFTMS
jgi:folate-binding protein YgfZ